MQTVVSNEDCSYEHWMRTICFNANDKKTAEAIVESRAGFNGLKAGFTGFYGLFLLLAAFVVGMAVVSVRLAKRNRKYEREIAELKQQIK